VIQFAREIFAAANSEATMTPARQPAAHEEHLDFQIFAALDRVTDRRRCRRFGATPLPDLGQ
jgi:hypothetical protein